MAQQGEEMKPAYPKILPWLARKAGIPDSAAEAMWLDAVREATSECCVIESPQYWKSASDHLAARIASESLAHHAAPMWWRSLTRLPAMHWLHGVTTAEAVFAIGLKFAQSLRARLWVLHSAGRRSNIRVISLRVVGIRVSAALRR